MKNTFRLTFLLLLLKSAAFTQTVNQLHIFPANPTSSDTIFVVSDLSYRGNCAFGLVYTYSEVAASTVRLFPTYCGYWDTTQCNSVDTFRIAPLPNGTYDLLIQYHQGSVCPISNFDATIFDFDTSFTVGPATSVLPDFQTDFQVKVYPNPSSASLLLESSHFSQAAGFQLTISHAAGGRVFRGKISGNPFNVDVSGWAKGMYGLSIADHTGKVMAAEKVVIE